MFDRKDFTYYDLELKRRSDSIATLFPEWTEDEERIAVLCPHDDDALLGAGYAWLSAMTEGADVYIMILCNGSCGYSSPEEKKTIVETRVEESHKAYNALNVTPDHITRFNIDDFCLDDFKGWILPGDSRGVTEPLVRFLRNKRVGRLLVPNDYREHPDHLAASYLGSYIGPQAGDNIVADWGNPFRINTYLKYSVWAKFSPQEPANLGVKASWRVEKTIRDVIEMFESQTRVIGDLFKMRDERRVGRESIEVYRRYDPRPKIDLIPYKKAIQSINNRV